MASREEAKRIVQRLTKKYGYLNEAMMEDIGHWKPEYRREIDENWLAIESTAAHSVKTLAKQIYGSGARFVFELLQNADDNVFGKARASNAMPFISFKMYPDHIIVECNEDGFTEKDLEAICAVGQSTKSASHGYIGAKGIGFKSVFIAAWRVHIQSGNFSFEFRHKRNDPGLGMVRPIWVASDEKLDDPLTRTTLYLHNEGDTSDLQHLKAIIFTQLGDLQQTCLLFLRKIQEIVVESYDEEGRLQKSRRFRKHEVGGHRVALETTIIEAGQETTQSRIYHITKQTATGLARSDNRELPDTDEARRISSTAEVVLAFPLTSSSEPLVAEKQDLFAFLPVRESDYKFIIHSDFDTSASRQDIVTTSRRNLDLRNWIATAFIQAALQFCEHPTLCYDWPRFLPSARDGSNAFWSGLDHKIQEMVQKTPIVRSRRRSDLRLTSDVLILTDNAKDADECPIFDDEVKDPFLSPKYSRKTIKILQSCGLKDLTADFVLDLLENDLRGVDSKMQGKETSQEWHTIVAKLLCGWYATKPWCARRLESLPLLPLRDGTWTSAKSGAVYFPTTQDIPIPQALDLRVLDSSAVENPARRTLFEHLGASEAAISEVRATVLRAFSCYESSRLIKDCKAYLQYLYLTHQPNVRPKEDLMKVVVITDERYRRQPGMEDIYLPGTNRPFSPEAVLAPRGADQPLSVNFLHSIYTTEVPAQPSPNHPTWERWLYDCVGIRERLRLVSRDRESLSEAFLWVFEHHADKFLGLFDYLWIPEGSYIKNSRALQRKVQDLPAKSLCDVNFSLCLKDTWLPLQHLRDTVAQYMEHPGTFPFLKLPETEMREPVSPRWSFLSEFFLVGKDGNVEFLLQVLRYIQRSSAQHPSLGQSQKVCDLYVAIYAKFTLASDQQRERGRIRDFFSRAGVLILDEEDSTWATSSDCLWSAPPDMVSKHSLKTLYARRLGEEQMSNIEHLFSTTVGIPAASLSDVVTEFGELRANGCDDLERVKGLYRYLRTLKVPRFELRDAFEKYPLICAMGEGQLGWYKASDCLWSSTTAIRGKVTLDDFYEELEEFFVDDVGVKSLTLQMVYDDLRQTPQQNEVDKLKVAIRTLSNFLRMESTRPDPRPILKANIFPVRYPNGTTVPRSADTDFAIGDREYLRKPFQNTISLLDFDLEDVRLLKPFFEWANLESRYLSNCIKEETSVSDDSGRPISSSDRDLKRKAYSILRVAATFNSPRYQAGPSGLYRMLRTLKVIETNGISSRLKISQNNQLFSVEETTGTEHISETSSGLIIYVPRKRKAQNVCFALALPRKFAQWLMRDPRTLIDGSVEADAISTLTSIFVSPRSALDDILDRSGIIQLEIRNEDVDDVEADDESEEDEEVVEEEQARGQGQEQEQRDASSVGIETISSSTQSSVDEVLSQPSETVHPTPGGSDSETLVEVLLRESHTAYRRQPGGREAPVWRGASPLPPRPSTPPDDPAPQHSPTALAPQFARGSAEDVQYRTLLDEVIEAARRATLPSRGAFDMSDLRNALPGGVGEDAYEGFDGLDITRRFRSANQFERDKKVGAAGELYVFELLSSLQLPGWSRGNWRSRIRTYAKIHPAYADMDAYVERETADIVYPDTGGQLTDILIDSGYLNRDEWHGARPRYYIEVKTTTGPCSVPFYMSTNQYQLMERIHHTEDRSEVYIIFRVFWLNSDRIAMCIYSDPEQLRQAGRLLFTGLTWSVVPGEPTELPN